MFTLLEVTRHVLQPGDWSPTTLLLAKTTGLLAVAWLVHLGLSRANPRWRVLLWRAATVGLVALPALVLALPTFEVRLSPHEPPLRTSPDLAHTKIVAPDNSAVADNDPSPLQDAAQGRRDALWVVPAAVDATAIASAAGLRPTTSDSPASRSQPWEPWLISLLGSPWTMFTVWCGPCKAATPGLKELHEKFGRDERMTFVGIDLDYATQPAAAYVREQQIPWMQVAAGNWGQDNPWLQAFAVTAVPSFWLIAPNGTVLARDVPLGELEEVIRRSLQGSK